MKVSPIATAKLVCTILHAFYALEARSQKLAPSRTLLVSNGDAVGLLSTTVGSTDPETTFALLLRGFLSIILGFTSIQRNHTKTLKKETLAYLQRLF